MLHIILLCYILLLNALASSIPNIIITEAVKRTMDTAIFDIMSTLQIIMVTFKDKGLNFLYPLFRLYYNLNDNSLLPILSTQSSDSTSTSPPRLYNDTLITLAMLTFFTTKNNKNGNANVSMSMGMGMSKKNTTQRLRRARIPKSKSVHGGAVPGLNCVVM